MAVGKQIDLTDIRGAEQSVPATQGALAWFLQRLTAGFLVVFLGAHLWILHYAVVGERITFEGVLGRMQSPLYFALDAALLGTVIYHALNGFRNVLLDFRMSEGSARVLTWVLIIVGFLTFVFGVNALFPFFTGKPLFYR